MIRFDQGRRRFTYRVVGVAVHDNRVLVHRAGSEPFWTLPGGRAEHGEAAEETLRREMLEELETAVRIERLLWVVENFFEFEGLSYHELGFYFLIGFPPESLPLRAEVFNREDAGVPLHFRWIPVRRAELSDLPLFPRFLAEGLTELPLSVTHVVERDTALHQLGPLRSLSTNGNAEHKKQ
jgi:ADP-ribose pyrophosphatase YjhB (NUDIX family)